MAPTLFRNIRQTFRATRERWQRRRLHGKLPSQLLSCRTYEDLIRSRPTRDDLYAFFDYHFHHSLPRELQDHKAYFEQDMRGFGERAFHSLWFLLFTQYRFTHALEIGVYRGQTVTLWSLLGRHLGYHCDVHALSPFTDTGDSVSRYASLDYEQDLQAHCRHFDVTMPSLCKALSTSEEAAQYVSSRPWDLIYIDGNHDEAVAQHDWNLCSRFVRQGGIIVLDDAALNTGYHPPGFATAGHPGPSKTAAGINATTFIELPGAGHNRVFQRVSTADRTQNPMAAQT